MVYDFKREPLRMQDADALFAACRTQHEKLVIGGLLDTGMRISELCNLMDKDIMFQERAIRVMGKGGPYGKMSKKRIIPMSERVYTMFAHYFAVNHKWFIKKRGAQEMVKRVANRAKITQPVSPHVLRHTFATMALQKGVSIAAVSRILGHDSLTTTQIYLNLTPAHIGEEFHRKW